MFTDSVSVAHGTGTCGASTYVITSVPVAPASALSTTELLID